MQSYIPPLVYGPQLDSFTHVGLTTPQGSQTVPCPMSFHHPRTSTTPCPPQSSPELPLLLPAVTPGLRVPFPSSEELAPDVFPVIPAL